MPTTEELLSAARRSETALCEEVSQWEPQPFGVVHWSGAFPDAPGANQLRDAWLGDDDGPDVFARVEAHFAEKGRLCRRWTPALNQDLAPVADLLRGHGWNMVAQPFWGLQRWDGLSTTAATGIRVLPARAMPNAYHQTYVPVAAAGAVPDADTVEMAAERLNDSRLDVFVAMREGRPAGRIGYLQVGDIARVYDLYVIPDQRGHGAARALVSFVLGLARRLLPRCIVAAGLPGNAAVNAFLSKCGFAEIGVIHHFDRPDL